ncbi:MAG TPA: cytochrome c/FTR1 family iron permease [Gammaproteobacteria bacterium]|nr:cytochrome c/FTR1 family iron permease [Gammaproteobacteria bacterium]
MIHRCLLALALFTLPMLPAAAADPQTFLQLVDYVGVDYPEAVADGSVINEAEYAEMKEFGSRIVMQARELDHGGALGASAERLVALIAAKAPASEIAATTRQLRERVLALHPVALTPATLPDQGRARALYAEHCAACHGAAGHGDGPLAPSLEPPPTDFHDRTRAAERSLYGLYNTITLGIEGTAMPSFAALADEDRWALAFYVGSLGVTDAELETAAALLERSGGIPPFDLRAATSATPNELAARFGAEAVALAFYLRHEPEALFAAVSSPFDIARAKTELAVTKARAGEREAAYAAGLSAYLDGFELAENSLAAVDRELTLRIEHDMMALRAALGDESLPLAEIEKRATTVLAGLEEARRLLEGDTLTPGAVFLSALVILLREGLEAILILGAIIAFLIKTGRRDVLPWVHAGWVGALALGLATWAVSTWLLTIGGATRELTEGITALFAAVVLFYVGFWMHSKLNAQRWNEFLREQVGRAIEGGTLWTLTLVSFVAVYREVFETVLFYQALWAQTGSHGQSMIVGGGATAAALLVLAAWLVFRFGLRLPLRQFFGASAAVMIVLAVIFAGKGVAALQEAGMLPIAPIAFLPRIELLGIYPSWQSIGLQLVLVAIAITMVMYNRRATPASD